VGLTCTNTLVCTHVQNMLTQATDTWFLWIDMLWLIMILQVLEGKPIHVDCYGNLSPLTKSGQQLIFNFFSFKENRLPFNVKVASHFPPLLICNRVTLFYYRGVPEFDRPSNLLTCCKL
jgi:hypothetical protein